MTRNEVANIGACLDSIAFCDERIVVDCGSDDGTAEIAKSKGARVTEHAWQGFGPQKNFALLLATGEWVLSIDADERVTGELAAAIRRRIGEGAADGYKIRRGTRFLGREMPAVSLLSGHVLRLFRCGRARFSDVLVHESVTCDGPVDRISAPLLHDPVDRQRRDAGQKGSQSVVRHRGCSWDMDVLSIQPRTETAGLPNEHVPFRARDVADEPM
jgi:glycosyltransferase involved in cell wall biosynthesis